MEIDDSPSALRCAYKHYRCRSVTYAAKAQGRHKYGQTLWCVYACVGRRSGFIAKFTRILSRNHFQGTSKTPSIAPRISTRSNLWWQTLAGGGGDSVRFSCTALLSCKSVNLDEASALLTGCCRGERSRGQLWSGECWGCGDEDSGGIFYLYCHAYFRYVHICVHSAKTILHFIWTAAKTCFSLAGEKKKSCIYWSFTKQSRLLIANVYTILTCTLKTHVLTDCRWEIKSSFTSVV